MAKQELLGENTRENIYHCIKCGLCIAHCPVYKEVLLEEATPRGKVQLSRHLSEGSLELTEDVKEAFFSTCLLCGSCVANCPSGVHGDHLFSGVRWRAVQRYGIDWKKRMMFQLLASKWKMSTSAWFGKWARKMFGGPWIESKLNAGALDVERIPPFNDRAFLRDGARSRQTRGKGEGEGPLFPRLRHQLSLRRNRRGGGRRPEEDGGRGDHPQGAVLLRAADLHVRASGRRR